MSRWSPELVLACLPDRLRAALAGRAAAGGGEVGVVDGMSGATLLILLLNFLVLLPRQ